MTTTFRAAYYVPADGQSDVCLTTEDQAHLSDAELLAAAHAEAGAQNLDTSEGEMHVGEYTSRW
jgi:hypothetical protein